jgi:hypothetical protein
LPLGLAAAGVLSACVNPPPAVPGSPTVRVAELAADVAKPEAEGYRCEGTALQAGGRDYCAYATPTPWPSAKRLCVTNGGQLAGFGSEEKARDLLDALGSPAGAAEGLWFGLYEPKEGQWTWSDGSPLKFTHWTKGEPNNDGGAENCAEWRLGTGSWNDAPCDEDRPYICEPLKAKGGPAPAMTCGGALLKTRGGEYCVNLQEPKSWRAASDACTASGGTLATLTTEEENALLYDAAAPKLRFASVWVGLNDLTRESVWKWTSGERARFFRWKPGEPNDFEGNEDCVEWFPEDGQMNDLSCNEKRPFLCERTLK